MKQLTFFIPGRPSPGGSKKHVGGGRLVDMGGTHTKAWRSACAGYAMRAKSIQRVAIFTGPIEVHFFFIVARPKCHFVGNGKLYDGCRILRDNSPDSPIVAPDLTKLVRSTEDALTGVIWRDDATIVRQHATKVYQAVTLDGPQGRTGCVIMVNDLLCREALTKEEPK